MARETKKEVLKRRKAVLFKRFKGTKWEDLFFDGEWEGDPELIQEGKDRLKKLNEEFIQEFGNLLEVPALKWKDKSEIYTDLLGGRIIYYSETVVGNQRFRLYFKDFNRRGKCDVFYSVRRNGRWKDIGHIGYYLWKNEAIQLVEDQILLGEDKTVKNK